MRSAKSTNSLASQHHQALSQEGRQQQVAEASNSVNSPTSPICRCRVMYLGSSVPHITKDGLQGIQEPLRELYPDSAALASGNAGIDSWLSVWSNGILIENVDETGREVKRFFKIDALHYCAAVKFVSLSANTYTTLPNGSLAALPQFLPLDSPHAKQANSNPPIFASILRRTTGIKVLECHAFICKREAAANALVRCCFHAYADTMYAKQIGTDVNAITSDINNNINNQTLESLNQSNNIVQRASIHRNDESPQISARRSKSIAALNEADSNRIEAWRSEDVNDYGNESHYENKSDNHQQHERNSMIRRKSINEHYAQTCDNSDYAIDQQLLNNDQLRKQHKLSKSMHHLNQNSQSANLAAYNQMAKEQINNCNGSYQSNQSSSASCFNIPHGRTGWSHQEPPIVPPVPHQPFYNPHGSRVPSYPPQNLIDAPNHGGTLKSIRSMAANSIASTLLRSKKHAKAMSMAQLNQDNFTSFHQPHSNASTMVAPFMMPPVPPMFMPNLPPRSIVNGSQTMKSQGRPMIPIAQQMNFEAMTPKEMKKLLKKSAKYGIDPSKFGENGLPLLPIRPPPVLQPCHMPHSSKGTMISRTDIYGNDVPDVTSAHGLPMIHTPRGPIIHDLIDPSMMKPTLVKPNPEFLKTKAGKKWIKQQKSFKKLLPPHLDGLPIIFGPPPVEALDPATMPMNNIQAPAFIPPHLGMPIMDSSGYYNPHPFYGQNGRSSAASTLLRYSPHSQIMAENANGMNMQHHDNEYSARGSVIYSNGLGSQVHNQREYVGDNSSLIFGNNGFNGSETHSRRFADSGPRHQKRNHMVEQSVISLGDENDYDDEEDGQQSNYYSTSNQRSEIPSHGR